MGNSSLRRQAAEALKKAGAPKLWKSPPGGCGYAGTVHRLRASQLRKIIHLASLKPGDIVFDCDGFNHRIKSFKWSRLWQGSVWIHKFEFDDGTWSCGCMVPEHGRTPEQINKEWFELLTHPDYGYEDGCDEWIECNVARLEALKAGKSICNEDGFVLPEFLYETKSRKA